MEVGASGGKTYYLRYQDRRGKTRQLRLADALDVALWQARGLADKARNQIALGTDPCEARVTARQVPTFAEFAADRYMPFVKCYKKSWASDECYLRNHLLPAFGKKHLDQITKHDVISFHHLSQDTLIDAANMVPFTVAVPMVSMTPTAQPGAGCQ